MTPHSQDELTHSLFEESGDALFLFDLDSEQILNVNPMAETLSGQTRQELLRSQAGALFRSDSPGALQRVRQSFGKPGTYQFQNLLLRTKDPATWVPINLTVARLQVQPKPLGFMAARDIREQRAAHAQLQEKEEELRRVLASFPGYLWSMEFNNHGRFTHAYHSPGVERITGRPAEFYSHDPEQWLSTAYPADRPRLEAAFRELRQGQTSAVELEYRVVWPDGTVRWVRNSVRASKADNDSGLRLDGVVTDIDERKRAEEALRASEMKYRSLAENLEQGVCLKDAELRYVAANQRYCRTLGLSEADIVGKTDRELFPLHLAAKYQAEDRLILRDGRRSEREEETRVAGQPRMVRMVRTPVRDDQGTIVGVLGILWDVTEQRLLENKVRQVQKMEAVGQLAGGVAHDFNNLLTVILGNVSLLRAHRMPEEVASELLNATEKAALRAAELTSKLLGFSRRTTLRAIETNLNACVEETVMILQRTLDPAITIEVDTAPDLWKVEADPSQINQVLMNLCLNARDAMPKGGRLRIETRNGILDEEYARGHAEARPGEFVRLRVEDNGQGMPPEVRQRIFEPFFTTKEPGRGTGLGLAMVFGIVKQHKGWIDCYSEVGRGTKFDIYLPRFQPPQEAGPSPAPSPTAAGGHDTILLVDDEPMIRTLGQNILQSYGYQVLLAENGARAVEIFQRDWQKIDLVILDLTMPGLAGREAYELLIQINPQARVLFASGYSAEEIAQMPSERVQGFVRKPYLPEELAHAVQVSLQKQQSPGTEGGSGI
ncbi:MAG TPA: PAS domain S-box protein [Gemmataceae bacterium]|nr:PAS domain S-box protein [Gemmataceae bacterium]